MTQRREIESRLTLYDDLAGILGAMRSFALAELHRITHREEAQQQVVQALTHTLGEVSPALLPESEVSNDIWLLFGSVRGFCGSFNEDVRSAWQASASAVSATIVVGERLAVALPENTLFQVVPGAESGLAASTVIDHILTAITEARANIGTPCGLVACIRDDENVRTQRLLPLQASHPTGRILPMMNESSSKVAKGVAEHFLFHTLLALLLRSIRVENRHRLMQMENALRHLGQGGEELKRLRNRLRQEEIVEEIELMSKPHA